MQFESCCTIIQTVVFGKKGPIKWGHALQVIIGKKLQIKWHDLFLIYPITPQFLSFLVIGIQHKGGYAEGGLVPGGGFGGPGGGFGGPGGGFFVIVAVVACHYFYYH